MSKVYVCRAEAGEDKQVPCNPDCMCPEIDVPQPVPPMTDADLRAEILYAMTRLGNVLKVLEERDRR